MDPALKEFSGNIKQKETLFIGGINAGYLNIYMETPGFQIQSCSFNTP